MHSFFVKKKTELCQNMQNTLAKPTMQLGGIQLNLDYPDLDYPDFFSGPVFS